MVSVRKYVLWTVAGLLPLLLLLTACRSGSESQQPEESPQPTQSAPAPSPTPLAELPADLSLVALVSKQQALPSTYAPNDLTAIPTQYVSSSAGQRMRQPAADALLRMLGDAQKEGIDLKVNSAYRSFQDQTTVFQSEVRLYGCAKALQESAVPGHSEHQLGLAVDLTSASVKWDLVEEFGQTAEGRWLAQNGPRYGFVMSYPSGKTAITGYNFEPWHFRYVTPPIAELIRSSGQTPTEFLLSLGTSSSTISAPVAPDKQPGPNSCPK